MIETDITHHTIIAFTFTVIFSFIAVVVLIVISNTGVRGGPPHERQQAWHHRIGASVTDAIHTCGDGSYKGRTTSVSLA